MSPRGITSFASPQPINAAQNDDSFAARFAPPNQAPIKNSALESIAQSLFLARREPPTQSFEHCAKPSLVSGWFEALGMFRDWALGKGADARRFEGCSIQSQQMSDAEGVVAARDLFYEKNMGRSFQQWEPVTNYRGGFGLAGLLSAGTDPTEQFVGSYRVDIFPEAGNNARFEVTNTTSMESFLYGLGPAYEREDLSYGGNMRQTYTWIEPISDRDLSNHKP